MSNPVETKEQLKSLDQFAGYFHKHDIHYRNRAWLIRNKEAYYSNFWFSDKTIFFSIVRALEELNKIYTLIIILPVFILGCNTNIIEEKEVTKKINSLDLNIFSKSGDKKYSITSPYSIYDNIKDKFEFN